MHTFVDDLRRNCLLRTARLDQATSVLRNIRRTADQDDLDALRLHFDIICQGAEGLTDGLQKTNELCTVLLDLLPEELHAALQSRLEEYLEN
jgi:hypothetical protein